LLVDLVLVDRWHLLEWLLLIGRWDLHGVLLSLVLEVAGSELELGEVDEDLLERGTSESEVRDETLSLDVIQHLEHCAELYSIATRVSKRFDFVKDLICWLSLVLAGGCLVKSQVTDTLRDAAVYDTMDILQDLSLADGHIEMITISVLLLEVTRRAKANKAAIYHDCNTIAESFSFVHPVSSQHYSRIFKMLKQLE
jgi:hypothetical protein